MPRFTHLSWKSVTPGTILAGTMLPLRSFPNKNGKGSMTLGEVEHEDGRRTGFTCPLMLQQQLELIPIGSHVKITYLGTTKTGRGFDLMRFAVRVDHAEHDHFEEVWK